MTSVLPLLFSLQLSQELTALIHSSITSYRGVGKGGWPTGQKGEITDTIF